MKGRNRTSTNNAKCGVEPTLTEELGPDNAFWIDGEWLDWDIPQLRQNPKFFMSYDAEIV
jgi:hypothetical protein